MSDESTREILYGIRADVQNARAEIMRLRDGHGKTMQRISDVERKYDVAAALVDNRIIVCEQSDDRLDERMVNVEALASRIAAAEKKAKAAHIKAEGIEKGDTTAAKKAAKLPAIWVSALISIGGWIGLGMLYGILYWLSQHFPWLAKLLPGTP